MSLADSWKSLPPGARAAIEQQWAGLAAGGLPCGASVMRGDEVVAVGRNHAYDPAGGIETRIEHPLQDNRLAHAELNALAKVPNAVDHASLTVWSTQHPCLMCAAAMRFTGIGRVHFIADDPSDTSAPDAIVATRGTVPYEPLRSRVWWTVCNLLFLYNSAVRADKEARNLRVNQERYGELVKLTLELARVDALGPAARAGQPLVNALLAHEEAIRRV
jgi:tRNA(Arg) A34 adenosine deaminase TadA